MSSIAITGGATGTGVFSLVAPSTSTNRTLTLPDATGTVLSTASTAVVTPTMLTQPFTSGTAVASTSGTSIDFNSIPSWVKRITVMFSGVSTDGSSVYLFQLGDSGGIETTGYQSVGGNYVAVTTSTAGFTYHNNAAVITTEGLIVISTLGSNVWAASGNFASVAGGQVVSIAGSKTLSGTLDRVRITTANGTDAFDAGSINILYE